MITTIDNPYNPYKEYEKWADWDARFQYHTPEYLGRLAIMDGMLNKSDKEMDEYMKGIEQEIIQFNKGLYALIEPQDKAPLNEEEYKNTLRRLKEYNDSYDNSI